MRQALRLPLPSSQISSIVRNPAARTRASPYASISALNKPNTTHTSKRTLSTSRANMSLLRPSNLFASPLDDFDLFPSSSLRDLMTMNPFAVAAASRPNVSAGDYRIWSGPKVDLHEEDTRFVLTAELPGVKKEDLKINVDADRRRLTLEGHMKSEYSSQPAETTGPESPDKDQQKASDDKKAGDAAASASASSTQVTKQDTARGGQLGAVGHALVSERVYGSFSRSFTLPPTANLADDSSLKARFSDGLLRLEIPKKKEEHSKTRQIAIETSG